MFFHKGDCVRVIDNTHEHLFIMGELLLVAKSTAQDLINCINSDGLANPIRNNDIMIVKRCNLSR